MIEIPDEPTPAPRRVPYSRADRTRQIIDNQHSAPHHLWPHMPRPWQPDWPTGWTM